ncbi:CapA family protein [Enterobacter cloacae]|uniref:CapA family protein n=1 Tax=Enterobacter cloacae TaxID=550 RepID=UPI001A292451|nr:CapA family protein [Enterobacter cloacae]
MINNSEITLMGYTGDLVLQDTESVSNDIFDSIKEKCDSMGAELVVNLESPFIKDDFKTIKNKICLGADFKNVTKLKKLNPRLINLSNNHFNDYGIAGAELTKEVLDELGLKYFGIGKRGQIKFIDHTNENVVNIAFTLRSADQSGALLFATNDIDGPGDLDLGLINKIKNKYTEKSIVVSVHWGNEDIAIPDFSIRKLAREIIDAGADLIIGHHPHIIQPMEIYRGKMIFYSLGNFYFPTIKYNFNDREIIKVPLKHQTEGIIPIFDFKNGIELKTILLVKNLNDSQNIKEIDSSQLIIPSYRYSLYPYLFWRKEMVRLIKYYSGRVFEKVTACLKLKKN